MRFSFYLLTAGTTLALSACSSPMAGFGLPLDSAALRPTPLHFGLHVTPTDNPIEPAERFEGYHTAVDFEIFGDEVTKDVAVYAACSGKVIASEFAEGYGGVLVQRCTLKGEDVTVLYGHLNIDSMKKAGESVTLGDRIAKLGDSYSHDTDGNRKHLHFSIHRGKGVQLLGYVQTESELKNYVNPAEVLGIHVSSEHFVFPGAYLKESGSGALKG